MATHMPPSLLTALRRLAPGTELRNGIDRIIQHGSGALVVLGGGNAVDELCTGGFLLRDTRFSEQRLAELAKMDGAIVLDESAERILRANVHLIPDASIATSETGTRHRTAERMAIQTGKPVVSVSEGRKIAVVFTGEGRQELESPITVLPRANQMVQSLDRSRRRLDLAEELVTRQELEGEATFRSAVSIIQRAEIIHRLGSDVDDLTVALGDEGTLIRFQATDLLQGVPELAELVIADYASARRRLRTLDDLSHLTMGDVHDPEAVAAVFGFKDLDAIAKPSGYRILSGLPGLPAAVKEGLVAHFKSLSRMMDASAERLGRVEGVGRGRAQQLRSYFEQLRQDAGLVPHNHGA
ncbi:MAG: DNA integrity scanning diadenylate cyclase DisA [Acidimicrobiia bacterium]|nr:DNA integrity scanning diadenylate cyclase DisA [Acidimicrobiia bacterium]